MQLLQPETVIHLRPDEVLPLHGCDHVSGVPVHWPSLNAVDYNPLDNGCIHCDRSFHVVNMSDTSEIPTGCYRNLKGAAKYARKAQKEIRVMRNLVRNIIRNEGLNDAQEAALKRALEG